MLFRSFPKAVELAKGTTGYQTCQRGKKMWFLATFATGQIMDALPLIECLSGLRNKTLYLDGEIKLWDEVFAFSGCAATRDTQLHPVEYCFARAARWARREGSLLRPVAETQKILAPRTASRGTSSQRLINGEPARFDDPIVVIGASESYEARCRHCHEIRK